MANRKERTKENQNIVQENALQLYVYENLCCTSLNKMKSFLNERTYERIKNISGNAKFKVVIPEYPVIYQSSKGDYKQHKTDFRLIDKNNKGINIEVEWKVSNFSNHGAEVYNSCYKGDKGFIIALENDKKLNYIEDSNIRIIDPKEFAIWFTRFSKDLIDQTLLNKISNYSRETTNIWMVPLLKNATINFKAHVLNKKGNKKWAFPYIHFNKGMRNILDIKAGDIIIFLGGFIGHGGKQGTYKNSTFNILKIGRVTRGYYCDLYDNTFEDGAWTKENIAEKKYMHYFEFEFDDYVQENDDKVFPLQRYLEIYNNKDIWKEVCKNIRWSTSQLSCPVKVTPEVYSFLMQMIVQYDSYI